ncbi:MAG: TA system VapC family ribonuclease toxin [Nakamurella sp.]
MSATVDATVLLHASNTDAPEHGRAKELVDRLLAGPALTTLLWPVLMTYLRTVTEGRIFARPLDPAVAAGVIDQLLAAPTVQVVGEGATFWSAYRSLDIGRPIVGDDVPDATIVALMLAHGVSTIYTRDRGFRRFDGIHVIDPFAG